jgi:hypothetical protein
VHYFVYKDVVIEGIALKGDPVWGAIGMVASVGLLWVTRRYAHQTAFQVYETADGKRLGFQMHDMVGRPGRRVEVSVGNVHFLNKTNDITRSEAEQEAAEAKAGVFNKIAGTSHVPIFVKGMGGNVLIDSEGKFYDKERLVALFNATAPIAPEATQKLARQSGWQERARRTGEKKST